MKIGYARVSTENQNLERQIDALHEYGVDELYTEKMTGTKASRPELDKVRLRMREGDSVVVESLSRLGRSTRDLLNLLDEFDKKGVQLISLKESIDTATPTGKLLVTVLSAISQFERDLIVQRTEEGLKAARARGRKGGRPKTDQRVVEKAIKLYQTKAYTAREVANLCGISVATLYRALSDRQ
ncbi:recombinase family protein [Fournierella massiliensis]|uniref:recombinase family protein n=1 Tax=Allofournierella massiliensis TaxID=1650663 RepID=UPI003521A65E